MGRNIITQFLLFLLDCVLFLLLLFLWCFQNRNILRKFHTDVVLRLFNVCVCCHLENSQVHVIFALCTGFQSKLESNTEFLIYLRSICPLCSQIFRRLPYTVYSICQHQVAWKTFFLFCCSRALELISQTSDFVSHLLLPSNQHLELISSNVSQIGVCVRACVRACVRTCVCCLLYTSPSPRDVHKSRMPSSA